MESRKYGNIEEGCFENDFPLADWYERYHRFDLLTVKGIVV